ncbi:MAG: hypothetical protein WCX82_02645 [archaeon]|jgi:ribosomal protein uL24
MQNKTIRPSKNRKRALVGVYHIKRKRLVAPIDKAAAKDVSKSKAVIRKGDVVKVRVGDNKGKTSTVERVNYDKGVIYLKDFKVTNSKGQEKLLPIRAANVIITTPVLNDKKRFVTKKPAKKK